MRYGISQEAIIEWKQFLKAYKIEVCDSEESDESEKIDASAMGATAIKCHNIIGCPQEFPSVAMLLFIIGNSKIALRFL
ncbi:MULTISPECIES: hypothetical protein [Bizionia]|uniref:hypothetical protein n=1 Tax=Bizionia TaxID=283785 RepID=UPI001FEA10B2|nr:MULTISPECIES: hypothetical protein [Bizionia]